MTPVEQPFEIFQLAHLARGRQKLKSNRPTHRNCTTTVPKTVTSSATTHGRFGKEDFIYNATTNEYRCPAGERLIWRFSTVERGLKISKYWSSNCQQCPQKGGCTPGPQCRVTRREHEAVLDDMQARLDHAPEMMRIRRQTVEHPFGTIKAWMGAAHFLTRTLRRVGTEKSLHVLAYNMKRVIKILGSEAVMNAMRACRPQGVV
ncbi:hypothetical protein OKW30_005991 [Paraburkholderia sp. Clong3]